MPALTTVTSLSDRGAGAHWLSPLKDNTTNEVLYWDVLRLENPPLPDLNNFGNLDEIVNWYVNFYKL